MRVNVYAEELTDRIELITKVVEDPDGATHTFYGVKFWLKFPNQDWWVHRKIDGEDDDDSSAVVFWGPTIQFLEEFFTGALRVIIQERVKNLDEENKA